MKPIIIGIAGTAKNTGKTTTTSAIMTEIRKDSERILGLTSIGYDGEDLDNITGLPKPKIQVWPGVIVAIAEKCLQVSTAEVEILLPTDITTPLGKVLVGRVVKGGSLLIAGPNKSKELREIISLMENFKCNFIVVDGALNRIAPMVEVDGIVLATGAARTTDLEKLALETSIINQLLELPVYKLDTTVAEMGSILDLPSAEQLVDKLDRFATVAINGIVSSNALKYLVEGNFPLKEKTLVYSDPIKLLVSADVKILANILAGLKEKGLKVGVKKGIKLLAITLNPYYPQFRFTSEDYSAAYVDKKELYEKIAQRVAVPVYNVLEEGGEKLYGEILKLGN